MAYRPPQTESVGPDHRRLRAAGSDRRIAVSCRSISGLPAPPRRRNPIADPTWESARPERRRAAAMGCARHHRSRRRQRHHHRPLRLRLQLGGADRHGGRWSSAIFVLVVGSPTGNTARSSPNGSARQALGRDAMDLWNVLEYVAWALSAVFALHDGLRPLPRRHDL